MNVMKAKKSFRKSSKLSFQDDDEETDTGPAITVAKPGAGGKKDARKKMQDKKNSRPSLLSFAEGEEEPVVIKKISSKARLLRQADAPSAIDTTTKPSQTQVSAPGEYSKERLAELQRATVKLPSSKAPARAAASALGGSAFKLSGSFKPAGAPPKDDRFNYDTAALLRQVPEEPQQLMPPPPRPGRRRGAAGEEGPAGGEAAAAAAIVQEEEEDDLGIPDADTIRRAKEKRERLRSAHLAPDYIPLGGAAALTQQRLGDLRVSGSEQQGDARTTSQASGSEEEGGGGGTDDEQEEHMRISFLGGGAEQRGGKRSGKRSAAASHQQQKSVLAAVAGPLHEEGEGAGPAGGDEEEDDSWAEEQIRKALGGSSVRQQPKGGAAAAGDGRASASGKPVRRTGGTHFGGAFDTAAVTAAGAAVLQTLREGYQRLQATHSHTQAQLSQVSSKVDASMRAIATLEKELEQAGERYGFAQQFKAYIADLCDMLQEKSPIVEVLEEELAALAQARGERFAGASSAGDTEELSAAQSAVAAALGVLSRGGSMQAAGEAGEVAYLEAETAAADTHLLVELDEFGRDANLESRREMQERSKARRERSGSLLAGPTSSVAEVELGMATSEEDEGEVSHFNTRRAEILQMGAKVFADADEAYASVERVKARLEQCKAQHRAAYQNAYVTDSAPALFAPFVRVQLLDWEPLYDRGKGFEQLPWFGELFEYGMVPPPAAADGHAAAGDGGGDDEDATLVPRLVAKLVLPLVLHRARHCWVPTSVKGTSALAASLEALLVFDLGREPGMQELLQLVKDRLHNAVDNVAIPPFPPPVTQAHARTRAILARRFGKAVRLLRSIAKFDGMLDQAWLLRLAVVDLAQGKLLPYMQSAATEPPLAFARLSRVVEALPEHWLVQAGSQRDLAQLSDFIHVIGRSLQTQGGLGSEASKRLSIMLAKFPRQ